MTIEIAHGVPHVRILPLAAPLALDIAFGEPPPLSDAVAAAWAHRTAANPRLFDGPLLHVSSIDAELGRIACRRERYARFAVQPAVNTGVRLLAVTGALIATDDAGRRHVFLGRRGDAVNAYPGQWEIGPSGGVPPPPYGVTTADAGFLLAHLREEILEEAGGSPDIRSFTTPCIARDDLARSDDLVLVCDVGPLAAAAGALNPSSWEYSQTRWLPIADVPAFDASHADAIIPPTRALFRALGWV